MALCEEKIGNAVFPPNKPLTIQLEFSKEPVVYDYLFFIDFNQKGECILGSSNVNGTFWEGTLLNFKNTDDLRNFAYQNYYIYSTTSDAKYINNETIALAEDTGLLSIFRSTDESLQAFKYLRHCHRIPQIAVWENSTRVLTCSDRSVSIFDIESADVQKFNNYHLDQVNTVDAIKSNSNLFISGASDRKLCLWDARLPSPASVIYSNEFCAITSAACSQIDNHYILAGTQGGSVYLIDAREPNNFVDVFNCFDCSINRITYDSTSDRFAVCGNAKKVLAFTAKSNLQKVYENTEHPNIVRDVKWLNGTLYSCGFGKSIIKHEIF